jgi:hypothetical protein
MTRPSVRSLAQARATVQPTGAPSAADSWLIWKGHVTGVWYAAPERPDLWADAFRGLHFLTFPDWATAYRNVYERTAGVFDEVQR